MNDTTIKQYIKHLNSIIEMFQKANHAISKNNPRSTPIPDAIAVGIISRGKTATERITGSNSHYTKDIMGVAESNGPLAYKAGLVVGILFSLKSDIEDGNLGSFSELIRAETFGSYLDMANYLLEEGYKDAAAVIAGSTMEAHLRQLCIKHGISINTVDTNGKSKPKSANQINQDLGKVAYNLYDQKKITAWQELRNNAAHGDYAKYSNKDVEQFIEWLNDFIAKNPA